MAIVDIVADNFAETFIFALYMTPTSVLFT